MPAFDLNYLPPSVSINVTSMLDDVAAFAVMADGLNDFNVSLAQKLAYVLLYASYHEVQVVQTGWFHTHTPALARSHAHNRTYTLCFIRIDFDLRHPRRPRSLLGGNGRHLPQNRRIEAR